MNNLFIAVAYILSATIFVIIVDEVGPDWLYAFCLCFSMWIAYYIGLSGVSFKFYSEK